jgi:endonuclease YncB( thermonuclease family)
MAHLSALLLSGVLFIPATVSAANFPGPVVSVLDGDTLEVLHNHRPDRIRLYGIDCPEKRQAYGQRAKHLTNYLY